MPTTRTDRAFLMLAGCLFAGGLLLIGAGLILHPPKALLRSITN